MFKTASIDASQNVLEGVGALALNLLRFLM